MTFQGCPHLGCYNAASESSISETETEGQGSTWACAGTGPAHPPALTSQVQTPTSLSELSRALEKMVMIIMTVITVAKVMTALEVQTGS